MDDYISFRQIHISGLEAGGEGELVRILQNIRPHLFFSN